MYKSSETSHVIVGAGEILWDMLPGGKRLGGAPANVAFHAHAMGAVSYILSAAGDDKLGSEIRDKLSQLGVGLEYLSTNEYPTGTVDVELDVNGTAEYIITENTAWDFISWQDGFEELAGRCNAVCFGSLAQRSPVSRATIRRFLQHTAKDCLKVFDINLRQSFYSAEIIEESLAAANILKLNDGELEVISEMLGIHGDQESRLNQILKKYQLHFVALTRDSKGSIMLSSDEVSYCPGFPVDVKDTIGAGDAFTASTIVSRLQGLSLDETNILANRVAGFVCGRAGATPQLPAELTGGFKRTHSERAKIELKSKRGRDDELLTKKRG
ncbi:Bifunctional protein HldE [Anaerohalosphaera lusitana]|uniref:Bifunctional protein HldE n=1 Tax=Anaerohalosphaera lusitana TaxID=1936003 RepID=A0A1U9NLW8_9BACT|nr:carbohydrate kinase [Anaerohalosphaera lusitana]AQT68931.1 Bifunctional protein HldE [Anaerohalosphaera lusitana]